MRHVVAHVSVLTVFSTALIPWIWITCKNRSKKGVTRSAFGWLASFLSRWRMMSYCNYEKKKKKQFTAQINSTPKLFVAIKLCEKHTERLRLERSSSVLQDTVKLHMKWSIGLFNSKSVWAKSQKRQRKLPLQVFPSMVTIKWVIKEFAYIRLGLSTNITYAISVYATS